MAIYKSNFLKNKATDWSEGGRGGDDAQKKY